MRATSVNGHAVAPHVAPPHPTHRFNINDMIATPAHICDCGVARIVGMEPGPNSRRRCPTWLYYVQFYVGTGGRHVAPAEGWFQATEEEVVRWQREAGEGAK